MDCRIKARNWRWVWRNCSICVLKPVPLPLEKAKIPGASSALSPSFVLNEKQYRSHPGSF